MPSSLRLGALWSACGGGGPAWAPGLPTRPSLDPANPHSDRLGRAMASVASSPTVPRPLPALLLHLWVLDGALGEGARPRPFPQPQAPSVWRCSCRGPRGAVARARLPQPGRPSPPGRGPVPPGLGTSCSCLFHASRVPWGQHLGAEGLVTGEASDHPCGLELVILTAACGAAAGSGGRWPLPTPAVADGQSAVHVETPGSSSRPPGPYGVA